MDCTDSPFPARARGGRARIESVHRPCWVTFGNPPTLTDLGLFLSRKGFRQSLMKLCCVSQTPRETQHGPWYPWEGGLPSHGQPGTCHPGVMGRGMWQGWQTRSRNSSGGLVTRPPSFSASVEECDGDWSWRETNMAPFHGPCPGMFCSPSYVQAPI